MTVVGIDTNSFGFHAVADRPIFMPGEEAGDDQSTVGWAIVGGDAMDRRHVMFSIAKEFFSQLPEGSNVFVEEPLILPKNIETTRKLVMMGGVLEAAFWQANPDAAWFWVDVSTWRRLVLGRGSGRKEFMKDLARAKTLDDLRERWLKMEERHFTRDDGLLATYDLQPDLYDAHCIMLYGRQALAAAPGRS